MKSSINKLSNRTHPCALDLNFDSSCRRVAQRSVAQRVARKRMMQQTPNPNELAEDGSNVVYRTGIQFEDYASMASYSQVEFLNEHDIVLAGTQEGYVDIVRLPRYQPSDTSSDTEESTRSRPMCTVLARHVKAGVDTDPACSIKSLQDGQSFVVGHGAGRFTVYATERSGRFSTLALDASQQWPTQPQRVKVRGKHFQCKITRMHRDYEEYANSVERMLRSFGSESRFWLDLNGLGIPSHLIVGLEDKTAWAFRERSSCVMASYLEKGSNSFSLSVVDSRMSQDASEAVSCVVGNADGSLNRNQFHPTVGHVSSTCFVSDHCLATLHLWQRPSQHASTTAVKIWDIRTATSSTLSRSATPVVETTLSPTLYDVRGNIAIDSNVEIDNQERWRSPVAEGTLIPSCDDNGLLVASMKIGNMTENYLLDATSASVIRKHDTQSAGNSINAFTPSLDGMAFYDSVSYSLSLYELWGHNSKCKGNDNNGHSKSRKRYRDSSINSEECNEDFLIGTIDSTIEDENGFRSRLSCLAFNRAGTSLIGGTDSGDLFLWRGG